MKPRLWKVKWHSLLTLATLLFQSKIESKDQTIKQWFTRKKRNTSSLTNQEVLFPKSKSDYIAACLKPFNGSLMPKGKKKPEFLCGAWEGLCEACDVAPHYLSDRTFKAPLVSFYSVMQNVLRFSQASGLFVPLPRLKLIAFSERSIFQNHPLLPPSNSTGQFIFKYWFSSKATLSEAFLPASRDNLFWTVTLQRAGPFVHILSALPRSRLQSVWDKGLLSKWGPVSVCLDVLYWEYVKRPTWKSSTCCFSNSQDYSFPQ